MARKQQEEMLCWEVIGPCAKDVFSLCSFLLSSCPGNPVSLQVGEDINRGQLSSQ